MISPYGIQIACALSDWITRKAIQVGDEFRWNRNGKPGAVHPDNEILRAVVLGKHDWVN